MKKLLPVLLIVGMGLWGIKALAAPDFFTSHDGPAHLSRLSTYIELLKDGQIPPRWSGSLNGRLGYPIFVYAYHLPFAIGALFSELGANLHQSIELVLGVGYVLSGLFMYLFMRESFGRWASLTGAAFYLFAPYRFSLLFVRAAIGESTALMFLPLALWAILKFSRGQGRKYLAYGGLAIAGAITSHPLFLPMFLPLLTVYALLTGTVSKTIKIVGLGLLISAFYLLPIVFERSYVSFDEVYTNQATSHLVTLEQLWHSPWAYGFSFPESLNDDMSFQLGLAQILASGLAIVILLAKKEQRKLGYFFAGVLAIATILMLESPWVRWIWMNVPGLKVIDFPWRFLGITTMAAAYLAAYAVSKMRWKQVVAAGLIAAAVVANRNHLRVNLPMAVNEQEVREDAGTTAYANEYKPIWRATNNRDTFPERVESSGTKEKWELVSSKSNLIEVKTYFDQEQVMQINSIYFPGWQAYELVEGKWEELELGKEWVLVDKELNKLSEKDIVGTTQIKVGPGKRQYKLEFGETPLRAIGNYLSVAGLVTAGGLIYSGNKLAHQEKGKRSDKKKSKNG